MDGGRLVAIKVRLEAHSRGPLLIWAQPETGRQYVIGADTAGGGSRGDFAVAVVVDAETCDVVAGWHERCDPHLFGPRCARLATYYNTAMLAIETQPSTHGLTAATEAKNWGYERLYHRRRRDSIRKTITEQLGWATSTETKPMMIDRIKKALEAGSVIPWEGLLRELKDQRWEMTDGGTVKMVGGNKRAHDDMVEAYGIALMARDDCYVRQLIVKQEPRPITDSERYWHRQDMLERASRPQIPSTWKVPHCLR